MKPSIRDVVNLYNPYDPLEEAWTIPAPYRISVAASRNSRRCQRFSVPAMASRGSHGSSAPKMDNFSPAGCGAWRKPLVVARPGDGQLRAFTASADCAAVVTEAQGCAKQFRCPYHGWTYGIGGAKKGMVEFGGV